MKLYIVTVIKEKDRRVLNTRTIGIFSNRSYAIEKIKNNDMDIWKAYYNYACIEEIESDSFYSFPDLEKRLIFQFNIDRMEYEACEDQTIFNEYCIADIG